jgi:hypothetical protein
MVWSSADVSHVVEFHQFRRSSETYEDPSSDSNLGRWRIFGFVEPRSMHRNFWASYVAPELADGN